MKKFIISVICALCMGTAFAAGENVATSKAFVDTAVAQKQDKISANSGATQVLTNTGESGTVGTKGIYNTSGEYFEQSDSLIDAAAMNAAVQNAINAEFKCVQYNPNDSNDCWLVDIFGATPKPSGKNLLDPSFMDNSTYEILTIYGNSWSEHPAKILPTEGGKTYTLSATLTWDGGYYYYLMEFLPDGTHSFPSRCRYMWNNNGGASQGTQRATCTFTTKENAIYIVYFAYRIGQNGLTLSDYQMEEGTVATEYEPYKNLYLPSGN